MEKIISTGGALSEEILQMKADILGIEIHAAGSAYTGAMGGAVLGAAACGIYNNLEEAAAAMVRKTKLYSPNMKRHRAYETKAAIYDSLYMSLRDINHSLGEG